jgi:antitoxin MazE
MTTAAAHTTLKHWGNSLAVRIPAAVVNALNLKENARVQVRAEAGHMVVEAAPAPLDIDALVSQITPENRHSEASFGKQVGKEVW